MRQVTVIIFSLPSPQKGGKAERRLPMFHMGGDEVNFDCWARDPGIVDWLKQNNYPTTPAESTEGFIKLWANFQVHEFCVCVVCVGLLNSKPSINIWLYISLNS